MTAKRILLALVLGLLPVSTLALNLSTSPLFIASTEPRVMLLLSRDHELSKKAYNDYSDLNGDGVLDTSYTDSVDYYGYFDPKKCYSYSTGNSRFEPASAAGGAYSHQCSGAWSGNFLNWGAMTRLDVVRKVLYGGFRSTDNTGTALGATVLERAFLPPDVHAFAKVYAPAGGAADVAKYTPYSQAAVTLCNVTDLGNGVQTGGINTVNGTNTASAPLIKVASGSWPQWSMSEILQCQWREDFSVEPGGVFTRPCKGTSGTAGCTVSNRLTGASDLTARVAVCAPGMLEDKCKSYYTNASTPVETVKPTGLLQQYGDVDADRRVRFGLMTSSYKKNTSGGVLRKNISLLTNNNNTATTSSSVCGANNAKDEIDVCTGQFIYQGTADHGIIDTLNRIHIAGYRTPDAGVITTTNVYHNMYDNSAPFACNGGSLLTPTDGTCVDWGNPLSEMYHEALRYFAGKTSATAAYAVDDGAATAVIAGVRQDTWDSSSDPLPSTQWCALSNIIVLSTGLSSLDSTTITTDIAGLDPTALTNAVGTAEGIPGGSYLIGNNGTTNDSLCSSKTLPNLSSASGICPEVPQWKGGYLIAGLADANRTLDLRPGYATNRAARWTGINANWVARQPLGTYTVGLAENLPSFNIAVGAGTITLVPTCRSGNSTICSLTDLRVLSQTATKGSFLVSWEDNAAGSDYDMDSISQIDYCVGPTAAGCNDGAVASNQMRITVSVVQSATGASPMEMGYTVSGSSADGTVYPIKIPGTATGDPTGCGGGSANFNFFSLLTSPHAYRCAANYETLAPASTYTCPGTSIRMPAGIVSATGCPSGSNCGCPKTATYTQSATAAGLLKNPLWYAAKYGAQAASWDLKNNLTGAATPDGVPDNFFDVRNPANLYTSMADVFDSASQPDASAASVATNSTNLQVQSRVFQAKFSSADWSGQLLSFKIDTSGVLTTTAEWDAGSIINGQNPSSGRVIITKGGTGGGVAFAYANLTGPTGTAGTQKNLLDKVTVGAVTTTDGCGPERVAYLRGDASHEGASGPFTCASGTATTVFRQRSTSKLGDIVNSNPWYVGAPSAGLSDVDNPGYAAFRSGLISRKPVVYVAANDGMLHGFDASLDFSSDDTGVPTGTSGKEVLAYVPSMVYQNLSYLTSNKYNKNHRYFVDGSPMVGDADLGTSSNDWRSVLIGSLGGGGKGYYALDISNPANFLEGNAATTLLWEFDETDMGNAFNFPPATSISNQAKQIVKLANGKWAAILGNGYNSASGKAVLYVVYIQMGMDGTWSNGDFVKIVVNAGPNNGLSTPIPFDSNGDGFADTVYAGDLQGHLWKILVGPNTGDAGVTSDPSTWKVAFSTSSWSSGNSTLTCTTCAPLFTATNSGGTAQPIIWPPEVTTHPKGGQMVLFGTGKYLENSDNANTDAQTFYGLWDRNDGTSTVGTRANDLLQQTVTGTSTLAGKVYRNTSSNAITWRPAGGGDAANCSGACTPTHMGWYIDLPTSGERTTGVPKLDNGVIYFNTFIPSTAPCDAGGTGWLMSLDYASGGLVGFQLYDTSGNGVINSSDTIVGGYQVGAALGGTTLIKGSSSSPYGVGVSSLTSGVMSTNLINFGAGSRGRINWRELIR